MKKDFQFKTLIFRVSAVFCLFFISQSIQAQVSGKVFRDFNSNGQIDSIATYSETGQIGIIVKAFNALGVAVGSATTNSNGMYSILGISGPLRIEFSNIPNADFSSFSGGTSVQFVNGGATNVNFGINYPNDYCHSDPSKIELATACYVFGNQTSIDPNVSTTIGSYANNPVLISFPYNSGSRSIVQNSGVGGVYDNPAGHRLMVAANQVGSTFGMAYARQSKKLYTSAFFKKHSGFGSGGSGAIYVTDASSTSTVVSAFTIPGATTNAHDVTNYNTDNGNIAWDAVGKTSLGGMDLSDDEDSLYVMNLEDRKLYAVNPLSGSVLGNVAVPLTISGCPTSNDVRPFAVEYYRGQIYVGIVCSGESVTVTTTPASSNDLQAYVFTVNPATLTFSTSPVLQFALNYSRGKAASTGPANWLNWRSTYTNVNSNPTTRLTYPMPMFTNIDFDNGNMIIGLRDRMGDIAGSQTKDNPSNTNLYQGRIAGDILRATGSPKLGWILENSGRSNGNGTSVQNTGQGPGGAEFYQGDSYPISTGGAGGGIISGTQGIGVNHDETSLGTMTQIPGFADVVALVYDPLLEDSPGGFFDGGVRWLNNKTGEWAQSYRIYDGTATGTAPNAADFGKAAGLGEVVAFCSVAPIQIGNRVWFDKDRDGIQDADEVALPGIRIALYDSTGTKVSEVMSNRIGQYYFDTLNIAGGKLLPLSRYEIRVAKTSLIDSLHLTNSNKGLNDFIDSDGSNVGGNYIIPVRTGNYGENNHTYDIGLLSCVKLNAGANQTFCQPADGNYKLSDASSGQTWIKLTGTSSINATTGAITGLISGLHEYILKYTDTEECADTVKISVNGIPSSDIISSNPECTNGKISIEAQFNITNIQNVEKVDYVSGSTFTGTKSYGSLPNIFPANTIITLPNPTVTKNYTIRLYNQGGNCFTDKTVELRHIECPLVCPPNMCLPLDSNKN